MLGELQYNTNYSAYDAEGKKWLTACQWIKDNEATWKNWIPPPSCPVGNRYNITAKTCEICSAGTYADTTSLQTCKTCPAGKVANSAGSSQCQECPESTFATSTGAELCTACPANTHTVEATGATNQTDCTCKPGFYEPNGRPGKACALCPSGATCPGGTALPYPSAGFYQISKSDFHECYPTESCAGGSIKSNQCNEGHTGLMCAQCEDGYFPLNQVCTPCTGSRKAAGTWIFGGIVCVLLLCAGLTLLARGHPWLGAGAIVVDFLQVRHISPRLESTDVHPPVGARTLHQLRSQLARGDQGCV